MPTSNASKLPNLTPREVTALCSAGLEAYNKLGPRGRVARFKWRGKSYQASSTQFRLLVHTGKGEPVACRWY
jgi:hypothetical protein